MTEILYCQSPALFLLAVVLLICFFLRRQAHRVRAALDLVLCILLLIGGVVLYYLGMYGDCFTIHDFWQIRMGGTGRCSRRVGMASVQGLQAGRGAPPDGKGRPPDGGGPPSGAGERPPGGV